MTENIVHKGEVMATIVQSAERKPGVSFFGDNAGSLQFGKHVREKGERIKPHRHAPVKIEREEALQEVLYIEKGKVKITFYYGDRWEEIGTRTLEQGDMILLIKGGHSFEMIEETVMIEIKQGPYIPESVERFEGGAG